MVETIGLSYHGLTPAITSGYVSPTQCLELHPLSLWRWLAGHNEIQRCGIAISSQSKSIAVRFRKSPMRNVAGKSVGTIESFANKAPERDGKLRRLDVCIADVRQLQQVALMQSFP